MRRLVERFEHFVYVALIAFLVVLLFFTLLELGWMVAVGVFEISIYRFDSEELFGLLGYFLLVLIGLELLETVNYPASRAGMPHSLMPERREEP
ncbi:MULTISPECIES: phosphate-starvation-inducible PsiE family protein [unclassified Methanoculleus]|uniref:phosphate-starvation-inducible PsiE family protein n=1 Tax=unclassified Methanoculleus TaxID=2619537 RepID=UPI0025DC98D0|nr:MULTISPECIES: phosphate-starvation-inducible PsiE family protein [unclassified Methanoculleus]MCK9317712.1 phosphate-starvation-inducible PsiE family protein [Methanoculleus sp.]MDD2253811.1 phosphate-starvation-inducible PsiE family protein [Methanoculleus sp.]MDD2788759.1 phosphate-starvation-inducible PsiE family protein [Methanoculleus sp.]MDD3216356.1 phosphate-starvation-inducible PsiE family protein [Methanoculleus sp.]MDD4313941.1 phosphate-starvation-inducible PsiE family protein [